MTYDWLCAKVWTHLVFGGDVSEIQIIPPIRDGLWNLFLDLYLVQLAVMLPAKPLVDLTKAR